MTMSTPTRLIAAVIVVSLVFVSSVLVVAIKYGDSDGLSRYLPTFQTRGQLKSFIQDSASDDLSYKGSYGGQPSLAEDRQLAPHSETNVQVAGVDEVDKVKTDGAYIYIASSDRVTIVNAYPPSELSNVTCIHSDDLSSAIMPEAYVSIYGIFVQPQKLMVIWSMSQPWSFIDSKPISSEARTDYGPVTMVSAFDLTDIKDPVLDWAVGVSGYPSAARMVGDAVYVISQNSVWWYDDVVLPEVWSGANHVPLALDRIYYDPETMDASSFINVLAVKVSDGQSSCEAILSGWASTIYMSESALYITFPKWQWVVRSWDVRTLAVEEDTGRTTIYKLVVDGLSLTAAARGDVKGFLQDQFSMDEKDGLLRVATSSSWTNRSSNVFVLNEQLNVIGFLEGIAPSEVVTSSRFVGDTLYLVTFRSRDPLFVIDLSKPTKPTVLGELTIPGFSSYLHPVDANHILGIGSENGSVKLSLFDVSDPMKPKEVSKWLDVSNSWSEASWDHKAVLFDSEKQLLVIPIESYEYNYQGLTYTARFSSGAYVFEVSADSGIQLRGVIEHTAGSDGGYSYQREVSRSLYIGDYLYTISASLIKVNSLSDLSEVASLEYFESSSLPYYSAL